MNEEHEWYEFLEENEIATTDEIDLVCNIAGYSVDTLSDILYARTGYKTMEQYLGEDEGDDETCEDVGEHLPGQDHRWQECPVYHEGEDNV